MSKRTEELKIRISSEDKERIKLKMEDAGILNMSAYIRKMATPTSRNCGFRQRQEPQFRVFVGTKTPLAK